MDEDKLHTYGTETVYVALEVWDCAIDYLILDVSINRNKINGQYVIKRDRKGVTVTVFDDETEDHFTDGMLKHDGEKIRPLSYFKNKFQDDGYIIELDIEGYGRMR